MKQKKLGKVIGITVGGIIAAAGITLGVMAACGVFVNHKKQAFALLAQMPERMGYSATNQYVGMEELRNAQKEKGSSSSVTLSDLKMAESLGEKGLDLSGYSLSAASQVNANGKKTNASLSLEKKDASLSLNCYMDKDKTIISAPELVKGKALQISSETMEENNSDFDAKVPSEFEKEFTAFMKKEVEKVKEEIQCEKLEEKDGYRLIVSKEAMDIVLDDFLNFMKKKKEMVNFINSYVDIVNAQKSEGENAPFDFVGALEKIVEEGKNYTEDFAFNVYEMDGVLIGLETPITVQNMSSTLSIEFAGVEEDSTVTMEVSLTYNGYRATITLIKKSVKTDVCSVQVLLDATVVGKPAASLTFIETIKPADNSYSATMNVTAMGQEMVDFSANGYIKNLNKGESVNYVLDEITLNMAGEEMLTMAMDLHMGVMNGEVEPPQGDVIEYTDSSSLQPYSEELMTNFMDIITKWDMEDECMPLLLREGYEDLTEDAA